MWRAWCGHLSDFKPMNTARNISSLRTQAFSILGAAVGSVDPETMVTSQVLYYPNKRTLSINGVPINLDLYKKIALIGLGESARPQVDYLRLVLGERLLVTTIVNSETDAELLHENLTGMGSESLAVVITFLGSQNFSVENPVTVALHFLHQNGASVEEISTVACHSSVFRKKLSAALSPLTVVNIILDADKSFAPTFKNITRSSDAADILRKYNVLESCGLYRIPLYEMPSDPSIYGRMHNFPMCTPDHFFTALSERADDLAFGLNECFAFTVGYELQYPTLRYIRHGLHAPASFFHKLGPRECLLYSFQKDGNPVIACVDAFTVHQASMQGISDLSTIDSNWLESVGEIFQVPLQVPAFAFILNG